MQASTAGNSSAETVPSTPSVLTNEKRREALRRAFAIVFSWPKQDERQPAQPEAQTESNVLEGEALPDTNSPVE